VLQYGCDTDFFNNLLNNLCYNDIVHEKKICKNCADVACKADNKGQKFSNRA
jgi:hypothetical protein